MSTIGPQSCPGRTESGDSMMPCGSRIAKIRARTGDLLASGSYPDRPKRHHAPSHNDQRDTRVDGGEISGVRRDDVMVVFAGVQDDVDVDDVGMA